MGEIAYYVRVSTDKQSNDRQLDQIREHLGEDVFKEAQEYADVGSGARDDRDDFQRLWSDIENKEIDELVLSEVSRLSRRLSTSAEFIDDCVGHEVSLETLADSFPTLKGDGDMMDKLMGQLTAWMMEYEREMIRERVQSGVNRAIEQGKWVGRPPFGFETDDAGYLVLQAEEYLAMQTAIETARNNPDKSVNSIARACGVPQSTLDRAIKNQDRAALYVEGDVEHERIATALND